MSYRSDSVRLQHMRRHCREAMDLAAGHSAADLQRDRILSLALTHLVEIVGEAAAQISESTRQAFPQVPWQQIIGMRNRLIHGYDVVDLEILWQTVATDLPALLTELDSILPPEA